MLKWVKVGVKCFISEGVTPASSYVEKNMFKRRKVCIRAVMVNGKVL